MCPKETTYLHLNRYSSLQYSRMLYDNRSTAQVPRGLLAHIDNYVA